MSTSLTVCSPINVQFLCGLKSGVGVGVRGGGGGGGGGTVIEAILFLLIAFLPSSSFHVGMCCAVCQCLWPFLGISFKFTR